MASKDPSQPLSLSLLNLAHPPETAQQIYTEKIQHRPLHLKPNPQILRRDVRSSKKSLLQSSKKKQKPRPLSARQKRALALYDLPTPSQGLRYEAYLPLHELWVQYIQGLLNLSPTKRSCTPSEAAKLCSADFHGAVLEVVRSRCVGRVGVKGVVVKDLMGVFEVVCQGRTKEGDGEKGVDGDQGKAERMRRDRKVLLPKEGTVFRFCVPFPEKGIVEENGRVHGGDRGESTFEAEGDIVMANTTNNPTNTEDTKQAEVARKEVAKPQELVFELHGDQFIYRAADRANRKFKPHFLKNL